MIFYLAALQTIPEDLKEAADIEGTSRWTYTRRIVLPLLTPTTLFIAVNALINSVKLIDHLFILTFAQLSFRGKDFVFFLVLMQLFILPEVLIVENYAMVPRLGLFDAVLGVDLSVISAATLMSVAPLLIAFVIFQRQFVQAFLRAGIK